MLETSKKQDMGSGSVPKLMLSLAIPAVVAQLINMLYNIVDRIYIGHHIVQELYKLCQHKGDGLADDATPDLLL